MTHNFSLYLYTCYFFCQNCIPYPSYHPIIVPFLLVLVLKPSLWETLPITKCRHELSLSCASPILCINQVKATFLPCYNSTPIACHPPVDQGPLEGRSRATSLLCSPPWCLAHGFLEFWVNVMKGCLAGGDYITVFLCVLKAKDSNEKWEHPPFNSHLLAMTVW